MRAVVYRGPGRVAIEQVADPSIIESTDAIVRVTLAGICGTDLHAIKGDFPGVEPGTVLGHEFVGEVIEIGQAVRRIRRGDEVMASDFTACGQCRWCDRQEHWHCGVRAFFGTGTEEELRFEARQRGVEHRTQHGGNQAPRFDDQPAQATDRQTGLSRDHSLRASSHP